MSSKYRAERETLDSLFGAADPEHFLAPGIAAIAERSRRCAPWIRRLREAGDALPAEWTALTRSYVHMHLNRLMRAAARAQEFVVYDFLDRRYRSLLARQHQEQQGGKGNPRDAGLESQPSTQGKGA